MDHLPPPQRRDNGLRADAFVALADVDPRLGEHLLDLLRLADIAAYLEPPGDPRVSSRYRVDGPVERLFVQSDLRRAAREVVLDAAREAGASTEPDRAEPAHSASEAPPRRPDPLAGLDTDAEFERIMAGFDSTAPSRAVAEPRPGPFDDAADAGRQSGSAGPTPEELDAAADQAVVARAQAAAAAEALDDADEHFVPPPAPPFPVPRANTVGAVAVLVFGLLVLARGTWFGLGGSASFPIGVLLILVAVGLFVRGLRETDPEDTDPEDGAIV